MNGKVFKIISRNHDYSHNQVESILSSAAQHRLAIVPLVQTFAHLEWILKVEEFAHLRDDPALPQVSMAVLDIVVAVRCLKLLHLKVYAAESAFENRQQLCLFFTRKEFAMIAEITEPRGIKRSTEIDR